MLHIIGAYLRMTTRRGINPDDVAVKVLVKQYGFTNNFSKTAELTVALKAMYNWVVQHRFATGNSPDPQAMLNFVKSRI
jgi:hypothetical protein